MVLARGLHEAAVRDQLGLQPSEVPTVAGGPASKGAHSWGWQVHAGCWPEDAVPFNVGFSTGKLKSPHGMATGFP